MRQRLLCFCLQTLPLQCQTVQNRDKCSKKRTHTMESVQLICRGPCGKPFHALCDECFLGSLTQKTLQSLTRRIDSIDETLRNLSTLLVPLLAMTAQQRELHLPTEIWEQIFQHLGGRQLARVRATCRRWRDVVDGCPRLAGKFVVKLPTDTLVDEHYEPGHVMGSAARVALEKVEIVGVGFWWRSLGERLTSLSLNNCKLSLPILLGMLKFTPNLKSLELRTKFCFATAVGDASDGVKLTKLEELTLLSAKNVTMFGPLCPRLKRFRILANLQRGDDDRNVAQFLQAVQHTVEDVDVYLTADLLRYVTELEQLQLKRISFRCISRLEELPLVSFCQAQWSIEDLGIERFGTTNATLCLIGTSLPKLSRITVRITDDGTVLPSFVNTMPRLKHLKINGNSKLFMTFGTLQSPHLTQLHLHDVRLAQNGLKPYLRKCPTIRAIILEYCTFDNWSEVFGPLEQLPTLRHLELVGIVVKNNIGGPTAGCFAGLRSLKLSYLAGGDMSHRMLAALLGQCGQLEEVHLTDRVDDEMVRIVGGSVRGLRRLTMDRCVCLTDASVEHVVKSCAKLEQLVVRDCMRITRSGLSVLKRRFPTVLSVND
uniref:F-box/LRR-repeat protein 20 n=2 Tax=Culex pipiens TaxID=7175 RepID=A0A8D8MA64_CULPI